MFLNRGEFVEINLDLLATYLFNDLSKTFTNVLQITKFYKNHKKISQRQSWASCGPRGQYQPIADAIKEVDGGEIIATVTDGHQVNRKLFRFLNRR